MVKDKAGCYNPDLLRFGRSNMDLKYNTGDAAWIYMSKYITKIDYIRRKCVGLEERFV